MVIPCCTRDQELLVPCVENLREVGFGGEIYVAPCAVAPPRTELPLSSSVRWRGPETTREMIGSLARAARLSGAEYVFKVDVDVFFVRRPRWSVDPRAGLTGWQHGAHPRYVFGAMYGVDAGSLARLADGQAERTQFEDVGVSRTCLRLEVPVWPQPVTIIGYAADVETRLGAGVDAVHLGQGIPRGRTVEALVHTRAAVGVQG